MRTPALAIAALAATAGTAQTTQPSHSIAYGNALYFCGHLDAMSGESSLVNRCEVDNDRRLVKAIMKVRVPPEEFCAEIDRRVKKLTIWVIEWKLEVRPAKNSPNVVTCTLHNPA